MSDAENAEVTRRTLQAREVRLYAVVSGLMVAGIVGLIAYGVRLGALTGPGVQSSFGLALALALLMAAVLIHLVDRLYRAYPFGRHLHPEAPPKVTDHDLAVALRIGVVIAAAGAVAYILGSLIAS